MSKSPKNRKKDLPPPLPTPLPPCDLTPICNQIQSFFAALSAAPSGSFLTVEDGSLVVIPPPLQKAAMVYDPATGEWVPGAWPPAS